MLRTCTEFYTHAEPPVKCYTSQVITARGKSAVEYQPVMQINEKALCRRALYSFPSSAVPAVIICNISDLQSQLSGSWSQSPGRAHRSVAEEELSLPGLLCPGRAAPGRALLPRGHSGRSRRRVPVPRWAAGWARAGSAGTQLHILLLAALPAVPAGTAVPGQWQEQPNKEQLHTDSQEQVPARDFPPRGQSWGWAETPQTCFGANMYIFLPST